MTNPKNSARGRWLFIAWGLIAAWIAAWIHAAEADELSWRVVVLSSAKSARLSARIEAELKALGVQTLAVDQADAEAQHFGSLKDAARRYKAVAAVRVAPERGNIEIWIADPDNEQTVFAGTIAMDETSASQSLLAVQTAELLRANLISTRDERNLSERAPPGDSFDPSVQPQVQSLVQPAKTGYPLIELEFGPGLSFGGFGLGPLAHLVVGSEFNLGEKLGVGILVIAPLVSVELEHALGEADIWPLTAAVDFRVNFYDDRRRFAPSLGGGMGATFIFLEQEDSVFEIGNKNFAVSATPYFRGGLTVRVTDRLLMRTDMMVLWSLKETVVRVESRSVKSWDQSLIIGYLGVVVTLGRWE